MSDKRYLLRAGFLALCLLTGLSAQAQSPGTLFYGTSSATQGNNTVESNQYERDWQLDSFHCHWLGCRLSFPLHSGGVGSWNGTVFLLDIGTSSAFGA